MSTLSTRIAGQWGPSVPLSGPLDLETVSKWLATRPHVTQVRFVLDDGLVVTVKNTAKKHWTKR